MPVKENPTASGQSPTSAPPPSLGTVAGQVSSEKVAARSGAKGTVHTEEQRRKIEMVKKIMFDFSKTARSFNIYSKNNEAIQQFTQALIDSITAYLEQFEVLSLRVFQDTMLYEDELVYENSNREESIALKLFKDGVKELVLQRGFSKEELLDFIEIMNTDLDRPEFADEDMVSLMWQKDFSNLSYFVVEGFAQDLDPAKKEQFEDDLELILSLVYSEKPPERAIRGAHLSKEDLYSFFSQDSMDAASEKQLEGLDEFKSHFIVTPQEIQKIQKEVESVSDADMIFQLVDIILAILAKEADQDNFMDIGDVLIQILDMLLLRGDFTNSTVIIKKLRGLVIAAGKAKSDHEKDDFVVERATERAIVEKDFHEKIRLGAWIELIIEKIGQEQRIEQVVSALNQGYRGKPSEIFDYLISLNASAVTPLINLLGDVQNQTHRRLICDAILIIHDSDITKIAHKLYDERWFVVSDMLYILGKMGHQDALSYMIKACEHPNPRVRGEAIGALRKFPIEKVRDTYLRSLNDENLQVQVKALSALAHAKDHTAVEPILEVIESKPFLDIPLNIKKRFFMTLAMIDGTQLTPYFSKTLNAKNFLIAGQSTDLKVCAAYALGMVASDNAIEILKKAQGSWTKAVREACREALSRAKMAGGSGGLILEPLDPAFGAGSPGGDLILEPIEPPARRK